jgi:hypothetical protein
MTANSFRREHTGRACQWSRGATRDTVKHSRRSSRRRGRSLESRNEKKSRMKTIHHVVDIKATRWKAWWALTEPAGLTGWWSTKLETPRPSSVPSCTGRSAGTSIPSCGSPSSGERRSSPGAASGGHDYWRDNTFRFQLATVDGNARLRLRQEHAVEVGGRRLRQVAPEKVVLLCEAGVGKPHRVGG